MFDILNPRKKPKRTKPELYEQTDKTMNNFTCKDLGEYIQWYI